MKPKKFETEAQMCAAFIEWATKRGVICYAEWAGWDVLVVYPDGHQLGIQAKLRLNAEVILQATPSKYDSYTTGPDFRAVLVPDLNPLSGVAERLGLEVFYGHLTGYPKASWDFYPSLDGRNNVSDPWLDWNPAKRHELPPVQTDSVAGSPCPVTLSRWKLNALAVLAEIEAQGAITTKRMRLLGCDPSRWLSGRWLVPAETKGLWVRGVDCPNFDAQHPTAWTRALELARKAIA